MPGKLTPLVSVLAVNALLALAFCVAAAFAGHHGTATILAVGAGFSSLAISLAPLSSGRGLRSGDVIRREDQTQAHQDEADSLRVGGGEER